MPTEILGRIVENSETFPLPPLPFGSVTYSKEMATAISEVETMVIENVEREQAEALARVKAYFIERAERLKHIKPNEFETIEVEETHRKRW